MKHIERFKKFLGNKKYRDYEDLLKRDLYGQEGTYGKENTDTDSINLKLIKLGKLLFIKVLINGNIDRVSFSEIFGDIIFEVGINNYSDNDIKIKGFDSDDDGNDDNGDKYSFSDSELHKYSTIGDKKVDIQLNGLDYSTVLQFDSEEERDNVYDGILSIMKNLTTHLKSNKKSEDHFYGYDYLAYSEYIAENLDRNIEYSEYISRSLNDSY